MNQVVREVLEGALASIETEMKWKREDFEGARRLFREKDTELAELHKQRKAIKDHLSSGPVVDYVFNVKNLDAIHDYVHEEKDGVEVGRKYRVSDNPTLDGEPAGPHLDNYLAFVPGDEVEVVEDCGDGTVEAQRGTTLSQTLDATSLEEL